MTIPLGGEKRSNRADFIPPHTFPVLKGNKDDDLLAYINGVKNFAEWRAQTAIEWYMDKKNPNRKFAQRLRLLAIIFVAIGGLSPFIATSGLLPNSWNWTNIGYISLGLSAACVGLDRFFGFSSSWIRFIITSLTLQKILAEFQYDWAVISSKAAQSQITPDQSEYMLRRVQAFMLKVLSEMEKEALDWAAEYRSNLAEMEKIARQQQETTRPGSISLKIMGAEKAKRGVSIYLDNIVHQVAWHQDVLLSPIYPGDHNIRVSGEVDGKEVTKIGYVRVEPGRNTALEFFLSSSHK